MSDSSRKNKRRFASTVGPAVGLPLAGLVLAFGQGSSCQPQPPGPTPGNVTTYHNDNLRTGQYPYETTLTRELVNASTFGKIGALQVDGQVYAQPLFVAGVQTAPKVYHNVLYVATEHDSVYAFDADSLSATPLWERSFLGDSVLPCTGCTSFQFSDVTAPNVYPEVGITATPVIDESRGTIYVIASTKEQGVYLVKLHALDLASGKEQSGSPVVVNPTFPGTGAGSQSDGLIHFDAQRSLTRSALALGTNAVYATFSSYNDQEPAHGWVLAFDPDTLAQTSVWMTSPNTGDSNIWMSGGGPCLDDADNLFFATGNGDPNAGVATPPAAPALPTDFDDSVVKVGFSSGTNPTFGALDYFMPYNHVALDDGDVEIGSGGVVCLPDGAGNSSHPHMLVTGGKQGTLYVVDRDSMGGFNPDPAATSDPQIIQEIQGAYPGGKAGGNGNYSTPSYFNGHVYLAAAGDFLRSYPVVNGLLAAPMTSPAIIAHRGATTSISSNSGENGIVWLADPSAYTYSWPAFGSPPVPVTNGPAVLVAYNADDVAAGPLYRSDTIAWDAAGFAVKFAVPTVANGRVFLGTDTEISVYGLRGTPDQIPSPLPSPSAAPSPVPSSSPAPGNASQPAPGSAPTTAAVVLKPNAARILRLLTPPSNPPQSCKGCAGVGGSL